VRGLVLLTLMTDMELPLLVMGDSSLPCGFSLSAVSLGCMYQSALTDTRSGGTRTTCRTCPDGAHCHVTTCSSLASDERRASTCGDPIGEVGVDALVGLRRAFRSCEAPGSGQVERTKADAESSICTDSTVPCAVAFRASRDPAPQPNEG
jgi:hypothetical protein